MMRRALLLSTVLATTITTTRAALLDAFDLIVDAASLATGGLRDLATVLYGLYDAEAPQVATVTPVGDLAVAPSIRARVLEDS